MNPALITFNDVRLTEVADYTNETAQHFADTYGLDYVNEATGSVLKEAHIKKYELTLRELNAGRPYVIWSDSDIVFKSELDPNFVAGHLESGSFMMLNVNGNYETSFFIAKNTEDVKFFLNTIAGLGFVDNTPNDDYTFSMLYRQYKWVRDMLQPIKSPPWISAVGDSGTGIIGKHFYSTSTTGDLNPLRFYKDRFFIPKA